MGYYRETPLVIALTFLFLIMKIRLKEKYAKRVKELYGLDDIVYDVVATKNCAMYGIIQNGVLHLYSKPLFNIIDELEDFRIELDKILEI